MTEYKTRFEGPLGTKFRIIGNGAHAGDPSELFFMFAALAKKFWVEFEKAKPEDAAQLLQALKEKGSEVKLPAPVLTPSGAVDGGASGPASEPEVQPAAPEVARAQPLDSSGAPSTDSTA